MDLTRALALATDLRTQQQRPVAEMPGVYTTVPDKAASDVFTEAMWDTYLRDNINTGGIVPIADTLLAASAASIDFLSIPATFANLMLFAYGRGDNASAFVQVYLRFNNDSGANYDFQLQGSSGTVVNTTEAFAGTAIQIGYFPGSTAAASLFGQVNCEIAYYANASNNKTLNARSSFKQGVATTNLNHHNIAGFWRSSAAINRITIFPSAGNLIAGTRVVLYGVGGLV